MQENGKCIVDKLLVVENRSVRVDQGHWSITAINLHLSMTDNVHRVLADWSFLSTDPALVLQNMQGLFSNFNIISFHPQDPTLLL